MSNLNIKKVPNLCHAMCRLPQIFTDMNTALLSCLLVASQPLSCLLPPVRSPIHQSLLQFLLSQSAASPTGVHSCKTVQYQIISLHGCVKWLGHPFDSSCLLTIFGCVSNPFSAQPWSCGSSAWRHCVSVDPYGAEHREGGMHSPPSTSYTHFARLGLWWGLRREVWEGGVRGCWEYGNSQK